MSKTNALPVSEAHNQYTQGVYASVPGTRTVVAFVVVQILLLVATCSVNGGEQPNVLLILVDDLKPAIGSYGDQHAKTPKSRRFGRTRNAIRIGVL